MARALPLGASEEKPPTGSPGQAALISPRSPSRPPGPNDIAVPRSLCPCLSPGALGFVETDAFQATTRAILLANIMQLAAETDLPGWSCWRLLDNIFLAAFATELILRIAHQGQSVWADTGGRGWAIFDSALVVLGILDAGCAAVFNPRHTGRWGGRLAVFLRMSRLARAVRIFEVDPRMAAFMRALISMSTTYVWVFFVFFLFALVSAIICTQLLGGVEFLPAGREWEEKVHLVNTYFGSVHATLFSLFRVTTQDNWTDIAKPTVALLPGMRLFFVAFIIFGSWTMIPILTAVASNGMIEATMDREDAERQAQLQKHDELASFLRQCFLEGDVDGDGLLDKAEYDALWEAPPIIREMSHLGWDMLGQDARSAWDMLDFQGTGALTSNVFVDGIALLQDTLSTKHVVHVHGRVKRTGARLEKGLARLQEEVRLLREQQREMLELWAGQQQRQQAEAQYLEAWLAWAQQYDQTALSLARSSSISAGPCGRMPMRQARV